MNICYVIVITNIHTNTYYKQINCSRDNFLIVELKENELLMFHYFFFWFYLTMLNVITVYH